MKMSLYIIFLTFLKLGCISFGGPVAHLAFFHREFVDKRRWIDEKMYMDLVSLCQTLPGPASSQVAMSIGMRMHGLWGGVVAILGFILPSLALLILAAYSLALVDDAFHASWQHGLALAVVAVIAQAVFSMAKRFCKDRKRIIIAIAATLFSLCITPFWGQMVVIAVGALLGKLWLSRSMANDDNSKTTINHHSFLSAKIAFLLFLIFLVPPFLINIVFENSWLSLFNIFYQTGAIVFGGGHVILPLLQSQLVVPGWINDTLFLTGYSLAQTIPGPLFSVAGFLGAAIGSGWNAWILGVVCTLAIYLPSILLLLSVLPWWEKYRHLSSWQSVLSGINAAVVGLLAAAFYHPVWTSSITNYLDIVYAVVAFVALEWWRWPPWLVVLLCAVFV